MNFNDLLNFENIDPKDVIVFRHRPTEPDLRKVLPLLAAERPDLFNAYQQTQGPRVEKAMLGARYIASFIGHEPQKAMFVGVYTIEDSRPLTHETYWKEPGLAELKKLGMQGISADCQSILWFELALTDFYEAWKGKLIIHWPGGELSWWRRADRNVFPVVAIREENAFQQGMPSWQKIDLGWAELAVLPRTWRNALAQWRGIYLIFDESDGKSYVGSAYGSQNILGRWVEYGKSGHGGNRQLKKRNPENFRFTILQRLSPDLDATDVIRIEASWKDRLHTRHPFGLNDN